MQDVDSRALLAHVNHLERRLKLAALGWVASAVGLLVLAGWAWQPQARPTPETLRVHQLEVADANGAPRVVIGAPKPDPQIRGKRGKRRSPSHGIQFNDANGDEIGGTGALEDGTMTLCFDYKGEERTTEHVCLAQRPNGAAGLSLMDKAGKTRVRIAISETGLPTLELLDEQEKALFHAPEAK